MNLGFPVKNRAAAAKLIAGLRSGHEKGLEKLVAGPPVSFQGAVSPRGIPAERDHGSPRALRAGLLHGDAGRP